MIKFAYKENGTAVEKEFRDYSDMILFVASNNIKDEDFVSLDMPGFGAVEGIDGLKEKAIANATESIRIRDIEDEMDELTARLDEIEDEIAQGADREYYQEEIDHIEARMAELRVEMDPDFECESCSFGEE